MHTCLLIYIILYDQLISIMLYGQLIYIRLYGQLIRLYGQLWSSRSMVDSFTSGSMVS